MALLHKLFSSKKNKKEIINLDKNKSLSWKPFNFNKDQIRVLLFRECEWRGRKLLFDTKVVNRITLDGHSCKQKPGCKMKSETNSRLENYVEITDGYGYQYLKPSSDTIQLGEMVFGSVAMTFQGSTLKVHQLKSPTRIMCTKVFSIVSRFPYNGNLNERSLEDSFGSSIHSMNEYSSSNISSSNSKLGTWSYKGSGPVDVPLCNFPGKSTGGSLEIDSGVYGNASIQSSSSIGSDNNFNCGSSIMYPTCVNSRRNSGSFLSHTSGCSDGSFGGLRRRWSHTINMSLENCTNSSSCSENTSSSYKHNTKLGLAVLVTFTGECESDMEMFFFEHMILVENMIERLRFSVEQAYIHKDKFVHLMMEGSERMQQWLEDLFSAPRLANPLWLRLTSSPKAETSALILSFVEDLCYLVANIDTKDTNFFVSTLLTAVLTHHLGWVSTVLPEKMMHLNNCKTPCASKLLKVLALSHPYNPLWAQLGDLCGALGHPTKIARTIVTGMGGKKVDVLDKILTSLSYFIRCGEISKKTSSRCSKELEDSLLKTSLDQSLPSAVSFKTRSLSTLEVDVSSNVSDESNSQKLNQILMYDPSELEQSVDVSPLEGESDLNISSEEIPNQEVDGKLIRKNHVSSILTNCSLLLDEIEESEIKQLGLNQNIYGNVLSERLGPRVEIPLTDYNNSLLILKGDTFTCSSNSKIGIDSENTEHFIPYNELNSSASTFASTSNLDSTSFKCGDVKYPELFLNESVELSNYEKNLKDTVGKIVLDGEATCFIDNSKTYAGGGMKRTSSLMSNLSNTSCTTNMSDEPNASNFGSHKEYCKIYPSLAELLMMERGSGLVIEELESVDQNVNPEYLQDTNPHVSRNSTSSYSCAKSSMTASCLNYAQKKPAVAALTQFNTYLPKKVESERQIASAVTFLDKFSSEGTVQKSSNRISESAVDTSKDSSRIVFLLGDEQLVGLGNEVHNSHSTSSDNDSGFGTDIVNVNTVNNSLSVCERCRTNEIPNVCNCDHSFVTTKVSNVILKENNAHLCSCKDFSKQFSSKTDRRNIVSVCSSCVELERKNCTSKEKPSVGQPHLLKCASSRSLNRLAEEKSVELCRSKSCSIKQCDNCKHNSFTNSHKTLFNCVPCSGNQNSRTLQETSKHLDSTSSEELRATERQSYNYFHLPVGKTMRDTSVSGMTCCKCVTSQSVCGFECSSFHQIENNSTNEGNEGGCIPSIHKDDSQLSFVELPMLKSVAESSNHKFPLGLAFSLLGATCDHYVSDLILQGCTQSTEEWQMTLRKDLSFVAHHMFLDQEVSEALCIVGNTDTWEVQLVSSHTYVVDKPETLGVRVGMSQIVANMLESLLNLWKMHTPPEHCLLYLESKLREVCLRSQALAELLLKTDFCDMEKLTVTLDLEANDVPLLLAVASTHTPQVTQRYGLCFC